MGTAVNSSLLAPEIQRDIIFANEVIHSILEELGDDIWLAS